MRVRNAAHAAARAMRVDAGARRRPNRGGVARAPRAARRRQPADCAARARARLGSSEGTWVGQQLQRQAGRSLTHPLPVTRAMALDAWARSPDYRALLATGAPLATGPAPATGPAA